MSDTVRLVLGGYDEPARVRTVCRALRWAGLKEEQLCIFRLSHHTTTDAEQLSLLHERKINGLRLLISSAALFDWVRLAEAEPYGNGAPWMPARQATALWLHIKEGLPALLAQARSSQEQIICSRMQLRHQPRFLHTFNFSRPG
jgi:hypothetical protein